MAKYYDTLLWEYIKNPWRKWLSLDKLAKEFFDYEMLSYDEITNKWKFNFSEISLDLASKYSLYYL
jgi:DNA polymerase I-like protein with 3'-5' exonuclease and polymerase domains